MDILKLIRIILLILVFLTSCREIKRNKYDYNHKEIVLKNWNLKKNPIHKISLVQYKEKTNFTSFEREHKLDTVLDYSKGHNAVFLQYSDSILTNKDHQLTINDSAIYRIKDIQTSYIISPYVPLSIDSVYNMIKYMNINGKKYIFDKPRVFTIPKEAHSLE
ncbi:hypothetical protein [Aquimarina sp. I32.4]|uniref:hypothetical protein n=1 Tax=Aquimarina sp. I32.4 TaxID=2053903 RepID=UPI000CDEFE6B|nr:hypothetical protein [Aquimarina sp. I32.4]